MTETEYVSYTFTKIHQQQWPSDLRVTKGSQMTQRCGGHEKVEHQLLNGLLCCTRRPSFVSGHRLIKGKNESSGKVNCPESEMTEEVYTEKIHWRQKHVQILPGKYILSYCLWKCSLKDCVNVRYCRLLKSEYPCCNGWWTTSRF